MSAQLRRITHQHDLSRTSCQHEAVLRVALNPDSKIRVTIENPFAKVDAAEFQDASFSKQGNRAPDHEFARPTRGKQRARDRAGRAAVAKRFAASCAGSRTHAPAVRRPMDYPSVEVTRPGRAGQLELQRWVGRSCMAQLLEARFVIELEGRPAIRCRAIQVQVQFPNRKWLDPGCRDIPSHGPALTSTDGRRGSGATGNVVGEYIA